VPGRRRAAKQRIWLGPDRYFSGCDRRIAHADADCNSNRGCDSDTNCNGDSDSGCVSDTKCNGNSDSHCNRCWDSDTNRNGDIHGTTYSYSKTCAIGKASAHTSAPAVAAKVSGH
jgi:hypothetical protein